jgi:hypothetical protein
MTDEREINMERLESLLADRAIQGLPRGEEAELEGLLRKFPDTDTDTFDRVAAEVDLVFTKAEPGLPDDLRAKLEADAVAYAAQKRGLSVATSDDAEVATRPLRHEAGMRAPRRDTMWLPWLAAAAGLLLAVVAWWPRAADQPHSITALREARSELIAEASDAVVIPWATAPEGVTGDVVWSNRRQEGYARFVGLPVNDASEMQYQLWVGDAAREGDVAERVDGGVFNVTRADGEVFVRFTPKLPVAEPNLFAVTKEKPGGVVVSDLSGLIIAAPVES